MTHDPARPVERYDGSEKHFPKSAKDGDAAIEIKFFFFLFAVDEVARITDVHVADAGNEGNDIGAVDDTIEGGFDIPFVLLIANARTAECVTRRDLGFDLVFKVLRGDRCERASKGMTRDVKRPGPLFIFEENIYDIVFNFLIGFMETRVNFPFF